MDYHIYPFNQLNNITDYTNELFTNDIIKHTRVVELYILRCNSSNISEIVDFDLQIEKLWKSCIYRPYVVLYLGHYLDVRIILERRYYNDSTTNYNTNAEHRTRMSN
jgi:hypothetical protein